MGSKDHTLDIVKGMAIILVVYGHVIEHSMAPWGTQDFFQNPAFRIIYTFHMPLFVFISGYLMANSLNGKKIRDVFVSRVKSLFIPFVSLSVLGSLAAYVLNSWTGGNAPGEDMTGILANQLFFNLSVWFLFSLFVMSAILLFSVRLEKHFGIIAFGLVYLLLMLLPYNGYCGLYYIQWFYVFYAAGYFMNRYKIKVSNSTVKAILFLVSLAIFSYLLTYWTKDDYIYINKMDLAAHLNVDGFLRLAYRYALGFLGIAIMFYLAERLSQARSGALIERIGLYSIDIYIIQMLILEGIYPRWVYKAHFQPDFSSPWVIFIVAPLISLFFIGVCILISRVLIRKNQLLNKLLLGARA